MARIFCIRKKTVKLAFMFRSYQQRQVANFGCLTNFTLQKNVETRIFVWKVLVMIKIALSQDYLRQGFIIYNELVATCGCSTSFTLLAKVAAFGCSTSFHLLAKVAAFGCSTSFTLLAKVATFGCSTSFHLLAMARIFCFRKKTWKLANYIRKSLQQLLRMQRYSRPLGCCPCP